MAKEGVKKSSKKTSALSEVITKEYTIHLHPKVFGQTFKKRAPTAIKVVRKFAQTQMKTSDVRLEPELNQALWAKGVKTVPHRIRVRLSRKRNDAEDAKEKLYTLVSYVPTKNFKGLTTVTVDE
ncbi:60S ribosomal protein L31 [Clydaea vesicula]|uniref:60S ribosomal protein L31 n=1 Tax=Clydaea vesicula TaxID=447962 RepID=A0AAD5U4M7_9FUNG|nr:60S ribosomal protein L31 [Clydaea vesicula]